MIDAAFNGAEQGVAHSEQGVPTVFQGAHLGPQPGQFRLLPFEPFLDLLPVFGQGLAFPLTGLVRDFKALIGLIDALRQAFQVGIHGGLQHVGARVITCVEQCRWRRLNFS